MRTRTADKDNGQGETGQRAALFPALSEGSKEKRAVSILLACMEQVPELSRSLLQAQGAPLGKKSRLNAWTEAGPTGKKGPTGRTAGLRSKAHAGRNGWRCSRRKSATAYRLAAAMRQGASSPLTKFRVQIFR